MSLKAVSNMDFTSLKFSCRKSSFVSFSGTFCSLGQPWHGNKARKERRMAQNGARSPMGSKRGSLRVGESQSHGYSSEWWKGDFGPERDPFQEALDRIESHGFLDEVLSSNHVSSNESRPIRHLDWRAVRLLAEEDMAEKEGSIFDSLEKSSFVQRILQFSPLLGFTKS
jgi:hypothetical protein